MEATTPVTIEPQKPPTTLSQYPVCSMDQPSSLWDTLCKVKNTKGQELLGASVATLMNKGDTVLTLNTVSCRGKN